MLCLVKDAVTTEREEAARSEGRGTRSPGNGGQAAAVLVDEVAPGVEHPAVVQGHERVPGRGGVVLAVLTVCVLQRGELVFPQHLIHHKLPAVGANGDA